MTNDVGRVPLAPGSQGFAPQPATPSSPVGADPSRKAMLPNTTYASCPICHGSRVAFDGPCSTCLDPEPALARKVLERLTREQMAYLRAYGHTLAYQPVSKAEHDAHQCELWVEDDDGVLDNDTYEDWLFPPTRHWFGSGQMRFGPCGEAYFISYNPLGLLLRECLMAGADAVVPHSTPRDSDGSGEASETRSGSTVGDSAGCEASPTPDRDHLLKTKDAGRGGGQGG